MAPTTRCASFADPNTSMTGNACAGRRCGFPSERRAGLLPYPRCSLTLPTRVQNRNRGYPLGGFSSCPRAGTGTHSGSGRMYTDSRADRCRGHPSSRDNLAARPDIHKGKRRLRSDCRRMTSHNVPAPVPHPPAALNFLPCTTGRGHLDLARFSFWPFSRGAAGSVNCQSCVARTPGQR